jgi:hypothetical protein
MISLLSIGCVGMIYRLHRLNSEPEVIKDQINTFFNRLLNRGSLESFNLAIAHNLTQLKLLPQQHTQMRNKFSSIWNMRLELATTANKNCQLRTTANNCQRLPTTANNCQQLPSTTANNNGQQLPATANNH